LYSLTCLQCIPTYYLNSQSKCQPCPLLGSNICTVDTLISCLPNYAIDSNGATCIQCDVNCNTCSSVTKCNLCNDGYYLNNFKCYKCMAICTTCVNGSTCNGCVGVGLYYNGSVGQCVACGVGCLLCTNATYCTACGNNNNNTVSYILNNGACIVASNPLPYCLQHKYISSTNTSLQCTQCFPDYFL
jgi:hypothetical protein